MKLSSGELNQRIEIYSDQDIKNTSGGVDPNSAVYWVTSAKAEMLSGGKSLQANQDVLKPTVQFTIRDRADKTIVKDMLIKWRGKFFNIISAVPDYVYLEALVITAGTKDLPQRLENPDAVMEWFYADQDYHNDELSIPEFQFSSTLILPVTSVQMDLTMASSGNYIGFRVPTGFDPTFTEFEIDEVNTGSIPGFNWYGKVTAGEHDYYLSRTPIYLNEETTILTVS